MSLFLGLQVDHHKVSELAIDTTLDGYTSVWSTLVSACTMLGKHGFSGE